MPKTIRRLAPRILLLLGLLPLAACSNNGSGNGSGNGAWLWIFHPNGPLARTSIYYLIIDVLLLGLIIVPATALVIWVFWRYRRGGRGGYDPTYNHSFKIEAVVWGFPLLLVIVMSFFSWEGIYALEPSAPSAVAAAAAHEKKPPLKVDVIATDWQWLFLYPQQHIAVANRLVLPIHRKVEMRLTATGATNDFYILKVVNQIYAMPGMRTRHNILLERTGTYRGFSTEFSGPGFAWMNYDLKAVKPQDFQQWVAKAQSSPKQMDMATFKQFVQPTINTGNTWTLYSGLEPHLFSQVIKAVKSGAIQVNWPMRMTEDMTSKEFRQRFGTKGAAQGAGTYEGTNVN